MIRKQYSICRENTTEGRKFLGKPYDTEKEAEEALMRIATDRPGWVGKIPVANSWEPYIYEIVPIWRNIPDKPL